MPQPTILFDDVKPRAQVIALDRRASDHQLGSEKQLRMLRLSDVLSRHLEIEKIIDLFAREIQIDIPHNGYKYECADIDLSISKGELKESSMANYRLRIHNRKLGEFSLFREEGFSPSELHLLEDLLCGLIYPIKNALMYQVALKSAYSDPLTGLSNRAAMEKLMPREIELANRHAHSMAILVMDLDGFKEINDSCGHDVGDRVLRDVGQGLQSAVRATDLLYRYGGDEFVGGLAQTDIKGALEVSERIRHGVQAMEIAEQEYSSNVGISIGVTMLRAGDSFDHAFKRADKALYQAKMAGKNRIMTV